MALKRTILAVIFFLNMFQSYAQNIIAVDVALLPSEDMMDKAIEVNRKLLETSDNEIRLNKVNCLPHITLAMGCVRKEDIEEIDKILENLADKFKAFRLKTSSSRESKAWFRIENNKNLQLLHETLMNKLPPYFTYEVTKEMIYKSKDEEINDLTLNYIRNFPSKSSFVNYIPHITVSSYDTDMALPEVEFTASKIALCHLGNHCTCRKVLLSHTLREE